MVRPLSGQKRGNPPNAAPMQQGQKRQFSSLPDHQHRVDGGSFAKLFVGSVPKKATEEDIRPPFEKHGNVVEVALIKDKKTGQPQGCCFIKYATSEEADRAICVLHNQYTFPGGVAPVQVRYADGERERLGTVVVNLFVDSLNKQASEKEVEEIFLPYGQVEGVDLIRDEMKQSRGCGFVKFLKRDVAMIAIKALNGAYTMRGCEQPLVVRFADPTTPNPGETSGAPALGGHGFGPYPWLQPPGIRLSNTGQVMHAPIPTNAWHPMSQHGVVPSSDVGMNGFGNQVAPLQIFPQAPTSNAVRPIGQVQLQALNSVGQTFFSQGFPSQPGPGFNGQLPLQHALAQAQAQPSVSSTTPALPYTLPSHAHNEMMNQYQLPGQQQMLQPMHQSASSLGPVLSQQKQTLQASYQPSQQAFSQPQQQVLLMQPSNPSLTPQPNRQSARLQMTNNTNTNINAPTLSLRSILEKDKLTGPNFLDWNRNLRIVLKQERKLYVLNTPLGIRPAQNAPQAIKMAYEKHQNDLVDVSCLMLATMIPDLQKNLVDVEAFEMIRMLEEMFHQGLAERDGITKALNSCKLVKGASVSAHVVKMKDYMEQLDALGYPLTQELATNTILNSLTKDYNQFVINFKQKNMKTSISELQQMLITVELCMVPKPNEILMARQDRVNKRPGKDKGKKVVWPNNMRKPNTNFKKPKDNKPKPNTNIKKPKDNEPETDTNVKKPKDVDCFHCSESGHWKRNCPKYMEELKRNKASGASASAVHK